MTLHLSKAFHLDYVALTDDKRATFPTMAKLHELGILHPMPRANTPLEHLPTLPGTSANSVWNRILSGTAILCCLFQKRRLQSFKASNK